jgi:diguanylate cyclase (GGDEF)-like protein
MLINIAIGIMRPGDSAARIGGDEFALHIRIQPNDDVEATKQRLQEMLQPITTEHQGKTLQCSASIGFHQLHVDRDSSPAKLIGENLRDADRKMYEQKQKNPQQLTRSDGPRVSGHATD